MLILSRAATGFQYMHGQNKWMQEMKQQVRSSDILWCHAGLAFFLPQKKMHYINALFKVGFDTMIGWATKAIP